MSRESVNLVLPQPLEVASAANVAMSFGPSRYRCVKLLLLPTVIKV